MISDAGIMLRGALAALLIGALPFAAPARAQDDACDTQAADDGCEDQPAASVPRYEDFSPEDQERIDTFIINNTIGTLYHELGHAFIDLFQLPVLGREEDAADSLSVLMMLQRTPDDLIDQMMQDSAEVYYMTEEESQALGYVPDFSGSHSLDLQRYYGVLCIVYGSNPERFQELADYEELPADRQSGCGFDYEQAANSWGTLLEPYMADGTTEGGRVVMSFDPARESHARLAALAEGSDLVQGFPGDIESSYVLPADLTVTFSHCDEENAWYYSSDKSITMCYEIMESFERMIKNNLVNGWQ